MIRLSIFSLMVLFMASCGGTGTSEGETADSTASSDMAPGAKEETPARVFFQSPADGDTVMSPVQIVMGVEGMMVKPAGQVIEGEGHHHLIIDGAFIEEGSVVPSDETHIHYGDGSTETSLELTPGTHTITMQFADGVHVSYGEAMSSTITVVVPDTETSEE